MRINEVDKAVTKVQLDALERALDKVFANVGIDVEFTRHFLDRVNDERNVKQISLSELGQLFKKEFIKYGKPIAQLGDNAEAVMKDLASDINIPFALDWNRKTGMLELIAKTVMRKRNFKTSNKEFAVESALPKLTNGGVLGTGLDPAQFQSKYGVSPKAAQTSIGNVIKLRPGFSTPRVSNAITQYMLDTPGALQAANDNKIPKGGKLPKWLRGLAGKMLGTIGLIFTPTPAGETPEQLDLLQKMQDIEKWMLYNDPQAFVDMYRAEWESLSAEEKEQNAAWDPKDNPNFQNAKDAANIIKKAKDIIDARHQELLDRLTNPAPQVPATPTQPKAPNEIPQPELPEPANDPVPPHRRPNQPGMPSPEDKPEWWPDEVVPFPKPDVSPTSPTQPNPEKPDDTPNIPGPNDKPKKTDKPVKPGSPVDPDGPPEFDPEAPVPGKDTPPTVDPTSPEQPRQPDEPDTSPDYDPQTDPQVKPSTPSEPSSPEPETLPVKPTQPTKPTIPTAPTQPVNPNTMDEPVLPGKLTKPDVGGTPNIGDIPAPASPTPPRGSNDKFKKRKKKDDWWSGGNDDLPYDDPLQRWQRKYGMFENTNLGAYLFESGSMEGVGLIHKDEINPTLAELEKHLKLNLSNFTLGSVGKKEFSGDIDVALNLKPEQIPAFIEKLKKSPLILDINVPIDTIITKLKIVNYDESKKPENDNRPRTGYVQLDFMPGDPGWLKTYYHSPSDKESKYKGVFRNILIAEIAANYNRQDSEQKLEDGRPLERVRYKWSPKEGLIKVKRTPVMNKKGTGYTKKNQDVIIEGPWKQADDIAKELNLDSAANLNSFETLLTAIEKNYTAEVVQRIKNGFKNNNQVKDIGIPEELD